MSNFRLDPLFREPYSIVCPECNGAGVIGVPDGDGEDMWIVKERCANCDGHGRIEDDSEPEYERDEMD